jgi:hypothetical protein
MPPEKHANALRAVALASNAFEPPAYTYGQIGPPPHKTTCQSTVPLELFAPRPTALSIQFVLGEVR